MERVASKSLRGSASGGWASVVRRAAWSLVLGSALAAGLTAVCVFAAPRSERVTQTWFGSPTGNLCYTRRSWSWGAHSVTIEVRSLTDREAVPPTVMPPAPPDAVRYSYADEPQGPLEPWTPLGDGLTTPPTAGEVETAGRWSETACGWPVRCLRLRGWDAGLQGKNAKPAPPPRSLAGRWTIALVPLPTAITVGAFSVFAFVLLSVLAAVRRRVRARRRRCTACGYPVPPAGVCPECGTAASFPASVR